MEKYATYNTVNETLLRREFNESNLWVRFRKSDDRAVEDGRFHCPSHHSE